MKECAVNRERAVITNNQVTEVAEPRQGALDFPAPSVASQRSSVLGHRFASIPPMRRDQFDPALREPLPQWGRCRKRSLRLLTNVGVAQVRSSEPT
jgi:hypothetical protein